MTDDSALRIFLVEDHALVRAAVRQALTAAPDLEVVGEAATAEDALRLVPDLRPDVVLIDIDLPRMRGSELVRELAPRFPDAWLVMLTVSRSERDLLDTIRSGARGYLSKDLSPDALVRAVRDIRQGIMPLSRKDATLLVSRLSQAAGRVRPVGPATLPELTARENEVLAAYNQQLTRLIFQRRDAPETIEELVRKWPMPRLPTPPPGKQIVYDSRMRVILLYPP